MKTFFKITVITIIIIVAYSCKKNNNNSTVPLTLVDFNIYANNPSFAALNAIGGYIYVTGGVRGILIFRKTNTDFMAYDRNCTYQSSQPCATVVVDNTHILAIDSCCGSKFLLSDGSVTHGPASLPLKAYNTTWDGNVLHVFN